MKIPDLAAEEDGYRRILRRLRQHAGMSMEQLAEAAGLCVNTVANLELGHVKCPWQSTHERLLDALTSNIPNAELASLANAYCTARSLYLADLERRSLCNV